MKTNLRQWQVVEDNGGGLHFFVFSDEGTAQAASSGYEHNPSNLMPDIQAWYMTGTVAGWDGLEPDPQDLYDRMTGDPAHGAIIAHGDASGVEYYPDRMGAAGRDLLAHHLPPVDHERLMGKALYMAASSGYVTDDPAAVTSDQWLVKDMADVQTAHYADLCHGIDPAQWGEGPDEWFARHGIEVQ
jgi:hypothetical protein